MNTVSNLRVYITIRWIWSCLKYPQNTTYYVLSAGEQRKIAPGLCLPGALNKYNGQTDNKE